MNRFTRMMALRFAAGSWALAAALTASADSPVANVVFYDGSPESNPQLRPLAAQQVTGYTTTPGVYNGASVEVQRLDPDAATGFGPLGPVTVNQVLPLPANQYAVLTNQYAPNKAIAFFGQIGTFDELGVEISPGPGTLQVIQQATFSALDPATSIFYSIDAGPEQSYTAGDVIVIDRDMTISYRGVLNAINGPTKSAAYTVLAPMCEDVDGDGIPDKLEPGLGLNPLVAELDANLNQLDDFDELIRGAATIIPEVPAPDFLDSDGDGWSNYDETLRQTATNDPEIFPAALNLQTVELRRAGTLSETAPGASPPPANPVPSKPYPTDLFFDVVNPGGQSLLPAAQSAGAFDIRTSGEQFHFIRARANDGSARMLLAPVAPRGLCVDLASLCDDADDLSTWRAAYRTQYEVGIFHNVAGVALNPRTTAEALLINRYYELGVMGGAVFTPGIEGKGPTEELVFQLRAGRNEPAFFVSVQAAVTNEMIDLVADYYRFYTTPGPRHMMDMLADHFAGRIVDSQIIPAGVRTPNIPLVATQTAAFFGALEPGATILSGNVTHDEFGFLLDTTGGMIRLEKLSEAFQDGTPISVLAIVDVDNCGFSPVTARVIDLISRGVPAVADGVDSDGDDLDDDWEYLYFGNLDKDGTDDSDGDGVPDKKEADNGTNPLNDDDPGQAWRMGGSF